jgi:hypothetical protein
MDCGLTELGFLTETLLLERLPGCATFRDSYRRGGPAACAGLR